MSSIAESISRFTDGVGDTITVTFKNISDFVDTVLTFFTSLGFWTSVLVFFVIFFLLISAPLLVIKYWTSISEQYKKVTGRLISSTSDQ